MNHGGLLRLAHRRRLAGCRDLSDVRARSTGAREHAEGRKTAGIGSAGPLGNSPLGNAIRGGLAGLALQGVDGGSLGKFGAGALAAQQQREQRDSQRVQDLLLAWRLKGEDAGDASVAPKVGDVLDGYVFLGGEPWDSKSWGEIRK